MNCLATSHLLVVEQVVRRARGKICAKPKTIVNLVTLATTSMERSACHTLAKAITEAHTVGFVKTRSYARLRAIAHVATMDTIYLEPLAQHIMWGNEFYTWGETTNGNLGLSSPTTLLMFGLKGKATFSPKCIPGLCPRDHEASPTLSQITLDPLRV